jgi:hypothetical protein
MPPNCIGVWLVGGLAALLGCLLKLVSAKCRPTEKVASKPAATPRQTDQWSVAVGLAHAIVSAPIPPLGDPHRRRWRTSVSPTSPSTWQVIMAADGDDAMDVSGEFHRAERRKYDP